MAIEMELMNSPPEENDPAEKKKRKKKLPRPPVKDAPEAEPHRPFVIRLLRSPLQLTLAVLCISPAVIVAQSSKFASEIKFAYLVLVALLIVYYIGHALFTLGRTWFSTQKSLSELLATFLFASSVMTVLQLLQPGPLDTVIFHLVAAFGWAFIGAAWAWDRMRLLNVERPRSRMWMLVSGWMALPGFLAAFAAILFFLASSDLRKREIRTWLFGIGASVCVSLGAYPALSVELKLRKQQAAAKAAALHRRRSPAGDAEESRDEGEADSGAG